SFCPNCGREKVLLIEAAELRPAPHKAPVCRCDECDGVMDFDDMEESYFAFLPQMRTRMAAPSARVEAVVREFAPTGSERRVRSRVASATGAMSREQAPLPSVPSLPSLSARSTPPGQRA